MTDSSGGEPPQAERDTGTEGGGEVATVADLKARLAEAEDQKLRALAEADNTRKRCVAQVQRAETEARTRVARQWLPVVDNLERAVEASKGKTDVKSIVEGVQMVLASLLDFLKTNGVRPMTAVGEQFDPNRHEAADQVHHAALPPNTIVDEFHRGYLMNDKVLRPARVVVSKGAGNGKGAS